MFEQRPPRSARAQRREHDNELLSEWRSIHPFVKSIPENLRINGKALAVDTVRIHGAA